MQLTVDTSWWTRYRSATKNPDFGDSFRAGGARPGEGSFPAIPRSDADLAPNDHIQAIANTAGFHFATIEQGGTSLYPSLAQRVSDAEVLRVLLSIGPTEAMHFQTWRTRPAMRRPDRSRPTGSTFPDLNAPPLRRRRIRDQPDHARAHRVPGKKLPDRLDHPPDQHASASRRARRIPDRDGAVQRAVAGVLQRAQAAREGSRRRQSGRPRGPPQGPPGPHPGR